MNRLFREEIWVRSAMLVAIITLCGLVAISCASKSSPTAPSESAAGTLTASGDVTPSVPDDKTAICHFQKDLGTWKVTMLSPKAFVSHLDKHDDAVPGGTTAITGTILNDQCKEVQ